MDNITRNWVIWTDQDLLVVNKPAGLPVLPDGYNPQAPFIKSLLEKEFGRLWIVHRLDKETSGVLLLARTAQAHRELNTQFETRQVQKTYHALVSGNPDWTERTVNLPLRTNGDRRHRTVVDPRLGKPAQTEFYLLETFKDAALIEARPHTGRTHQIRTHLAATGYPILADVLYNHQLDLFFSLIQRPALHARSIEFAHPLSAARLHFEAPYSDDFAAALENLRKLDKPHR